MMTRNFGFNWCLYIGAIGFIVGFLGPIVLSPDANQGPLLGIFITGPIGFCIGLPVWWLSTHYQWNYTRQKKVLASFGGLFAMVVAAISFWPKPHWVGRFYQIEVLSCAPAVSENETILQTKVLAEKIIKEEKPLFKPSYFVAFPISRHQPWTNSFYTSGPCERFPNGFQKIYFVSDHPTIRKDLATLETIPETLRDLSIE